MNFVYICKDGDNEELKYSIRSVVQNCPVTDVFVVGGKPDWYTGNYISVNQKYSKYKNAFNNFKTICETKEIPEDFILMNDDFFIMKPTENIVSYYNGTIENKIEQYESILGRSSYINKLKITQDRLLQLGISNPLNYEIHVPMKMSKQKFCNVLGMNHNLLYRSIYGNLNKDLSLEMTDVKVYSSENFATLSYNYLKNNYPFLSTESASFIELKQNNIFKSLNNKTKYEK